LASAVNEELLRLMGIAHVLLVPLPTVDVSTPSQGGASTGAFSIAACTELGERLGITVALVRYPTASPVLAGETSAALLGEACDLIALGRARGGVLVAGSLEGGDPTVPGPAWLLCAYLASVPPVLAVGKAFKRCRDIFPRARLSSQLAAEAERFAATRHLPSSGGGGGRTAACGGGVEYAALGHGQ
jgi:hypothetical protein